MIRCAWCGARNYAIDIWCTHCQHHLDFQPAARRRRGLPARLLPPAAAAVAVAIALALPAAAMVNGSLRIHLVLPTLPNTGARTMTSTLHTDLASSPVSTAKRGATPAPSPDSASPGGSTPPATNTAAHLPAAPPVTVPAPALKETGDPAAAVDRFYQAVSAHHFDLAASLWSAPMKSAYPPAVFIDQRFSATQHIGLRGNQVLADKAGSAVVSVDILELIGGQTREWVGTWQLIQGPSGWLLNSPDLHGA